MKWKYSFPSVVRGFVRRRNEFLECCRIAYHCMHFLRGIQANTGRFSEPQSMRSSHYLTRHYACVICIAIHKNYV